MASYDTFIKSKADIGGMSGFEPKFMPDDLFDFQASLVEWAIRKGKAAIFADCGLGKTLMQLTWAQNVVEETNRPVLIATPLAVAQQTKREAEKFGIDAEVSRDGKFSKKIVITNYEKMHHFDESQFDAMVCDESSILKSYQGARRKQINRFIRKLHYRLLCTATAAPNDYTELGTSSEALGELSHSEMIKRFFKMLDNKGIEKEQNQQDEAEVLMGIDPNYFKKLSYRVAQTIGQWRLKHHAVDHFWRWVASWARACRKPSDCGYADGDFILPKLQENIHLMKPLTPPPGHLFSIPAVGLRDERQERTRTLVERCDFVAELVNHDRAAVVWCHSNAEGDLLEKTIPGAAQIAGRTPDERKVELYEAFSSGELKKLVIKPKIGAWGLNWQHCNHVVTFASHSYEQYYQSVRRCWRFGQKKPVAVDVVATTGESRVVTNMNKKAARAEVMFDALIREMNRSETVKLDNIYTEKMELPQWL